MRVMKIGPAALLFLFLMSSAFAPPQRRSDDTRPSRRRRRPAGLKIGQEAPDFELPVLIERIGDDGKKVAVVTTRKIRLSSHRREKIVCIFMSSYT